MMTIKDYLRIETETETENTLFIDDFNHTLSDYIPKQRQNIHGDNYIPMLSDFYAIKYEH